MPRQGRNGLLVSTENANIPHHAQIEYPRGLIPRRSGKQVVIDARESRRGYGVLVTVERGQTPARPWIPEFDLVILGTRDQQSLCRMPIAGLDVPVVTGENGVAGSGCEIKDLECCVVGSREEFGIAWCPGQISHCVVMGIVDRFDVVEVWSPVFDVASLSARDQPFVAMRPGKRCDTCLDLIVMRLFLSARIHRVNCRHLLRITYIHHRLKIKSRSIPKHKLSRVSTRQQPSAFGRPPHHDNRFFRLSNRLMQMPYRYRVGRRISSRHGWKHLSRTRTRSVSARITKTHSSRDTLTSTVKLGLGRSISMRCSPRYRGRRVRIHCTIDEP